MGVAANLRFRLRHGFPTTPSAPSRRRAARRAHSVVSASTSRRFADKICSTRLSTAFCCAGVAAGMGRLRSDHFHAGEKTKFVQQFFAVIPSEAEGAHIRHTEPRNDG